MIERDDVFRMFGPKLLEGIIELIFKHENMFRSKLGLPALTKQQMYDEITNVANNLPDYKWMSDILENES